MANWFTGLWPFGAEKQKQPGFPLNNLVYVNGLWVPVSANDASYIKTFKTNDYVNGIVTHIASKMSDAPGQLMRVKNVTKAREYYKLLEMGNTKNNIWKVKKEAAFEEVDSHPIQDLMNNPNPLDTEKTLKEQWCGYRLITGNGYLYFDAPQVGDKGDQPVYIWSLPSPTVSAVLGDRTEPIKAYRVGFNINDDIPEKFIMHSRKLNLNIGSDNSWVYGQSPLQSLCSIIGLTNEAVQSMGNAFNNQGASGIISGDGESIDEEQGVLLNERMQEKIYSRDSKGRIVITAANVKYIQLGFAPADLKVIEADEIFMRRIANVFHYPFDILTGEAKYTNANEADKQFITKCVLPEILAFDEGFTRQIQRLYKDPSLVWVTDLQYYPELADDRNKRAEYLSKANWLSVDEKRVADDYDALGGDEGEAILVPAGLSNLKDVINNDTTIDNLGDI